MVSPRGPKPGGDGAGPSASKGPAQATGGSGPAEYFNWKRNPEDRPTGHAMECKRSEKQKAGTAEVPDGEQN